MSSAIRGAVPIVASVLANHRGVPIVWGNFDTASTDGQSIRLPDLPLVGEELGRRVYGYVVHECSHIKRTDFELLQQRLKDETLKVIWNFIEDPVIERAECKDSLGARYHLVRLMEALDEEGKLGKFDPALPLVEQIQRWLMWRVNVDVMGYEMLRERLAQQEALMKGLLPADLHAGIEAVLAKVPAATCTADTIGLAEELLRVLQGAQPQPQQPQQQQVGGSGQPENGASQPDDASQPQGSGSGGNGEQGGGASQPPEAGKPQGSDAAGDQAGGAPSSADGSGASQPPEAGKPQGSDAAGDQAGGAPSSADGSGASQPDAGQPQGSDAAGDQAGGAPSSADGSGASQPDAGKPQGGNTAGDQAGGAPSSADGSGVSQPSAGQPRGGSASGAADQGGTEAGGSNGNGGSQADDAAPSPQGGGAGGDTKAAPGAQPVTQPDGASSSNASPTNGQAAGLTAAQVQQLLDAANWNVVSDRGAMVTAGLPAVIKQADAEMLAAGTSHGASRVHMPRVSICSHRLDGSIVLQQVRRHTTAVRTAFDDALQDMQMRRVAPARSGRRLMRDFTARSERGSAKLFRRQDEREDLNASLFVLIDKSLSMKHRIQTAMQSALLMALALEETDGVQVAVGAFPEKVGDDKNGVVYLKDFDDSVRESAGRIGSVRAEGGTPLASALLCAQAELSQIEEGRRIVLVATDGDPDHLEQCKAVMQHGLADVEYLGIGIGLDVSHLFKQSIRIDSIDELPRKALELVRSVLFAREDRLAA